MRNEQERILVVERRLLEEQGIFQGLTFDTERYLPALLDARNYRFLPRGDVEENPAFKQLIPYFIVSHADRIWMYVRGKQSGEGRLVARASIGIGGHINHHDEDLFEDTYSRAATRELEEEINLPPGCTENIVALLNDDATPVGRVHLGVVHLLVAPTPDVRSKERALIETGFKTVPELRRVRAQMETWSQICLDRIEELCARGRAPVPGNG
jgi:predicted NUDIX family phosphoesterase